MPRTIFPQTIINLDGEWMFSLGPDAPLGKITVPGCWEAQGYSVHVEGPAVYRRKMSLPADRGNARVFLELDAVSYACEVSIDDQLVGTHEGMWTPFSFDITDMVAGRMDVTLQIEVWKPGTRYPVRESLAGFLPDVATTFGGLWQSCRLRIGSHFLRDVRLSPNLSRAAIGLEATAIGPADARHGRVEIVVRDAGSVVAEMQCAPDANGAVSAELSIPHVKEWAPELPHLYDVATRWIDDEKVLAEWAGRAGFRELTTQGDQLLFNGRPMFLRGVLSWGWDPNLLAPRFDRQRVRRELSLIRSLGFNMVKLCLFVPNQELFDVADETGMFLWQELPLWLPEITPALAARAPREYAEYARLVCSHPSVVLYTLGCEMGASVTPALLAQLDAAVRPHARGALVCDNSGSGESYGGWDADVADFTDYHPYYDMHWFEPLLDNWRRDWKQPRPWIFGEFCDQDAFRDRDAIRARNGGALPWWMGADLPVATWRPEAKALLEADERLERADLGIPDSRIAALANKRALVTRKYTLETLRKRASMGGYVITGLADTPISTSGVFDDAGEPRMPIEALRACNDEVVLCIDVPRRRAWTHGGDRPSRIDMQCWWAGEKASWTIVLSTFAHMIRAGAAIEWRLERGNGAPSAQGRAVTDIDMPAGVVRAIATIEAPLPPVASAEKLTLKVTLASDSLLVENAWPIWVFSKSQDLSTNTVVYDPSFLLEDAAEGMAWGRRIKDFARLPAHSVVIATSWDDALSSYFDGGGRILFWQLNAGPFPCARGPFWREAIPLFAPHRLWDAFPHDDTTDMQFFGMATDVMLDGRGIGEMLGTTTRIQPVLRRLDARSFLVHEYVLEASRGKGRMLLSTLRFHGGAGAQPSGFARNIAGHALFAAMIEELRRS